MEFTDALGFSKKEVVSLVGAGGKTSVLFALGKEAKQKGIKTILTTTTKIYCPSDSGETMIISAEPDELFHRVNQAFTGTNLVITGRTLLTESDTAKLAGFGYEEIALLARTDAELIVIEADGAAGKPLKAPAEHEPVIPPCSTIVMPVAGIDCLDRPLSAAYCHRPEAVAQIAGVSVGDTITHQVIAAVFTSKAGYRKGVPLESRWLPFINKAENPTRIAQAKEIARLIRQVVPAAVLIGAATGPDPVKDVIGI